MPPQLKKGPQPPKAPAKTPSIGQMAKGLPNGMQIPAGLGEGLSAYQILAQRLANRVAEMAENYTIVEKCVYLYLPAVHLHPTAREANSRSHQAQASGRA